MTATYLMTTTLTIDVELNGPADGRGLAVRGNAEIFAHLRALNFMQLQNITLHSFN